MLLKEEAHKTVSSFFMSSCKLAQLYSVKKVQQAINTNRQYYKHLHNMEPHIKDQTNN